MALESDFDSVYNENAFVVCSSYGFPSESMTDCEINMWYTKTAMSAPELNSLSPTDECFEENVKHAHFQCAVWYPNLTVTLEHLVGCKMRSRKP